MSDPKAKMLAAFAKANPHVSPMDLAIYVDATAQYQAAQANIDTHGSIVIHPRTGAPIENPYLAVRDRAARVLLAKRLQRIRQPG